MSAPSVIAFDELTGKQLNKQVEITETTTTKPSYPLPWREWFSGIGSSLGHKECDRSSAVAVLHGLHVDVPVDLEPIEVWQREGTIVVIATRKVHPFEILLPPCVPKTMKVLDRSEHPHAARIKLKVLRKTEPLAPSEGDSSDSRIVRTSTFFVNPEFKAPMRKQNKVAVAEASGQGDAAVAEGHGDEWAWGQQGGDHAPVLGCAAAD